MKMSNKTYDQLKYIALQVVPALEVFLIAIGEIWSIDAMVKIAATVAAFGVFLGACLIKSNKDYQATAKQTSFNDDSFSEMMEEGYADTKDDTEEQ